MVAKSSILARLELMVKPLPLGSNSDGYNSAGLFAAVSALIDLGEKPGTTQPNA